MGKSKLQNVKAIKEMLQGTHKFQTRKTTGFSDVKAQAEKNKKRAVGEVWEEKNPVTGQIEIVEQHEGFRSRKSPNTDTMNSVREYLRSFPNCQKDKCTCIKPNHLDEKMRKYNGMCYDCTIEFEHNLKKDGKFNQYAFDKMKNNALEWIKQVEKEVEVLKETYTKASKVVVNGDGVTDELAAPFTPKEFEEKIENSFNEFKENLLNKIKEYEEESKKNVEEETN